MWGHLAQQRLRGSSEIICGCCPWESSVRMMGCRDGPDGGTGTWVWGMGRNWKEGAEQELRWQELHPGRWGTRTTGAALPDGTGRGWRGRMRTGREGCKGANQQNGCDADETALSLLLKTLSLDQCLVPYLLWVLILSVIFDPFVVLFCFVF